ncbi:unnamed protein product [Pipistrellus nathusii]|uniref:Beta-retroviral matrix protein domain-containing protein n=1 Tax=Pipistrellus nathusii TaxID=59473 RepID=A0ABN9Z9A2_PIPNA
MGQALSSREIFLKSLKESLKTRGVRVKKKDLRDFFIFLTELCPWFPQEGTIDIKCWSRVGSALQDYYKLFGPEKVPVSAFSFWNLINDVLKVHSHDPDIQKVIETGETALKEVSRPPSLCRSVSIDLPEEPKQKTSPSDANPSKTPPPPSNIYPALTSFSTRHRNDELPPPEDQATLEEEATRYHNPDWPFPSPLPPLFSPLPMSNPFPPVLNPFPPETPSWPQF